MPADYGFDLLQTQKTCNLLPIVSEFCLQGYLAINLLLILGRQN